MKILLLMLFCFSVDAKMYLKLSGDTIIGHDYTQHDDYLIEIEDTRLVGPRGRYIYKYSGGKLVPLTLQEIDSHPNVINKPLLRRLNLLKKRRKTIVEWQNVISGETLTQEEIAKINEFINALN